MDKQDVIYGILPDPVKKMCKEMIKDIYGLNEIRLRTNKPVLILYKNREIICPYSISAREMKETFEKICEYSTYAFEEEMRQGYITIQGGHRIGIAGKTITEDGRVKNIKHISCLNIRVATEIKGCAGNIMHLLYENGRIVHTLIISLPGGGKTTLLRDIIRQVSDGFDKIPGMNVGVVDERSEICACYHGMPQNDIGIRTDVLDSCPKAEGMMRLVRSMSPKVIAVDEIGTQEDLSALKYVFTCGCSVITTLHGNDIPKHIFDEKLFERYIILDSKKCGRIACVFDQRGKVIWNV